MLTKSQTGKAVALAVVYITHDEHSMNSLCPTLPGRLLLAVTWLDRCQVTASGAGACNDNLLLLLKEVHVKVYQTS